MLQAAACAARHQMSCKVLLNCTANTHIVPPHGAGCGMCAVPVDGLHRDDVSMEQLLKLQSLIKRRIPTGFEQHKAALPTAQQAMEEWSNVKPPSQ